MRCTLAASAQTGDAGVTFSLAIGIEKVSVEPVRRITVPSSSP